MSALEGRAGDQVALVGSAGHNTQAYIVAAPVPVCGIDDLMPCLAEALDFALKAGGFWNHGFALPAAGLFPGRFHAGFVRYREEGIHFDLSDAPLTAEQFVGFIRKHEPNWSSGSVQRWPCTGADSNPLADCPRQYMEKFYGAIRGSCQ